MPRRCIALALLTLASATDEGHAGHPAAPQEEQANFAQLLAAHADEGAEEESKHGGNEHEGQSLHGESNEGHGGKASHGESGEEKPNPVNLAVSFMLLGSVIFNMSIFYLVNHHDPDIKHNSWAVLSSTIAIFVSVLMFSGIQGILDAVLDAFVRPIVPDQVEEQAIIWIRFANMGVWYVVLYHTLRRQAQFLGTIRHESGRIMSTTNAVMDMQQKLTCWATLFGHMAGFAAISGGTAMQEFVWGQTENFPLQVLFLVLTILVTACVAFVFFLVADRVLACWSTVYRHEVSERIEEYGFEAEVEMAALGLSFLIVQVLTTVVLGKLPVHGGGEHHPPPLEPVWHTVALVALALVFMGLSAFLVWVSTKVETSRMGKMQRRWFYILQTSVTMSLAWCLTKAFEWEISRFLHLTTPADGNFLNPNSAMHRVLTALATSLVSFAMIFALDYLHDLPITGDLADSTIRKIIASIGVLVGFSWEEAFNCGCQAFAGLARSHWGTITLKFVLGLLVAITVVPAWRLYILKNLLLIQSKHHHGPPEEGHDPGQTVHKEDPTYAPLNTSEAPGASPTTRGLCCGT